MAKHLQSGPRMRNVDPSRFSMVPRSDVPRSAFDIMHTHKTTFNAGWLVPIFVDEVLPGDSLRVRLTALARLSTPIVPVMDNLIMETFFFFVPNRLTWDNWKRFMGEQAAPTDSVQFLVPTVNIGNTQTVAGSIYDYFGLTLQGGGSYKVNSLPLRAYNLIWNEFFRDQDLQGPIFTDLGDGPDDPAEFQLQRRGKRHDYFTSARPWPEKPAAVGDTGVFDAAGPSTLYPGGGYTFPGAGAPVSGIGLPVGSGPIGGTPPFEATGNRTILGKTVFSTGAGPFYMQKQPAGDFPDVRVLINDIRTANMIQLLMEKNARGGTRYTEILRAHFGVISPDARLQRPEYLGGGRSFVSVNPVAQTSATNIGGSTTPLGELAGVGTAVMDGHGFSQSFTEHGHIIGLVNVRADLTYQQGVNRMWFRRGRYDYYWPSLAHLGEQAILQREIFASGLGSAAAGDGDYSVFGYQERWSEYKYKPSRVSGMFRSIFSGSIDYWHLAQQFPFAPLLGESFIWENPPLNRILAVEESFTHHFLFDGQFDCRYVRAMPMFSIPGLGGRF